MQFHYFSKKLVLETVVFLLIFIYTQAQPITGIWKGKMGNSRVELKLIRKGDSLIGTSYYYDSKSNYRRYSVKGYFDDRNNDVIWYDDVLIEDHSSRSGPLLAVADFNCPGEGVMKLDGKSSGKEDNKKDKKELHLVKGNAAPVFPDEWDFLIENYAYGVSHPEVVDSIEQMAFNTGDPTPKNETGPSSLTVADPASNLPDRGSEGETGQSVSSARPQPKVVIENPTGESNAKTKQSNTVIEKPVASNQQVTAPVFLPPALQTNEERFTNRTKILQNVIPIKGDSIELRFYDNAEIDGDSIAVFLNGRLLREHILLAEEAYTMKIAVSDLQSDNELVMVAENLGSIPPNTSLMVAIVEDKRYEAHLQSTEGSSALVRLVKP
jgi:hypothetical protein